MRRASLRAQGNPPVMFRTQIAACWGDQHSFRALVEKPQRVWVQLWAKAGLGLDLLAASHEKA